MRRYPTQAPFSQHPLCHPQPAVEQGALVPYTIADGGTSTTVYLTRELSDQCSNDSLLSVEDIVECGLLLLQTPQPDDTPRQKCRQVMADEIWVIESPNGILFLEPNDM